MQRSVWNGIRMLRDPLLRPQCNSARFHSTPSTCAKRNAKVVFNSKVEGGRAGRLPKNYVRFSVRLKRADAKRALHDFLLNGSYINKNVQNDWQAWYGASKRGQYHEVEGCPNDFGENSQSSYSRSCKPNRTSSKKTRRNGKKCKRWWFVTDDEETDPGTTFEAMFEERRTNFWSKTPRAGFKWRDNTYSPNGKQWSGTREQRQNSNSTKSRRGCESESDYDSEEENSETGGFLGSSSHRTILGLPSTGPLKIKDIKTAFHMSALKWHPDKHQGASQAMAGEKFKLCVEAYNSLCNSLNAS